MHFLLLGFLLESYFKKDLDQILQEQVLDPWKMKETQFGPVSSAVPTVRGQKAGVVQIIRLVCLESMQVVQACFQQFMI